MESLGEFVCALEALTTDHELRCWTSGMYAFAAIFDRAGKKVAQAGGQSWPVIFNRLKQQLHSDAVVEKSRREGV